jgi:hypothetical protein
MRTAVCVAFQVGRILVRFARPCLVHAVEELTNQNLPIPYLPYPHRRWELVKNFCPDALFLSM